MIEAETRMEHGARGRPRKVVTYRYECPHCGVVRGHSQFERLRLWGALHESGPLACSPKKAAQDPDLTSR